MSKGLVTSVCLFTVPRAPSTWYLVFSKHGSPRSRILEGTCTCQQVFGGRVRSQCKAGWFLLLRCTDNTVADEAVLWSSRTLRREALLHLTCRSCFCSTLKSRRKLPAPRFPSPNSVIKFHQSYRDASDFSSITKTTFKSLTDIFPGTDYKD